MDTRRFDLIHSSDARVGRHKKKMKKKLGPGLLVFLLSYVREFPTKLFSVKIANNFQTMSR